MDETKIQGSYSRGMIRRISVGLLLILGGWVGQCAGGHVPDDPTTFTRWTLILCVVAATMAFAGKAGKTVITLSIISLLLIVATVFLSPRHWNFGGIPLFDIVALLLIFLAVAGAVGQATKTVDTKVPPAGKTTCDKCGYTFPSHYYLKEIEGRGYLCEQCRRETA
jgi:peptidoglycan/LPS O-acetylase OafA/YrhL